jgi:DNA repair exonuclease SbcCD ATPase subunit
MSFGFSIGDFIAIGKLVKDISSSLQDVGGAKSEYQELLRELECLKQALQHLNKLHNAGPSSPNLDSIKYAALSCRRPLEQFLEKIRKYDKSLCVSGTGGLFKGAVDKVRWGLGQKEEVRKLQSYLNVHVGTINILLAEFGLEKMDIALNQADKQYSQVKETLNSTRSMIGTISSRLVAQKAVLQSTKTMLARLCDFINGDFRTSWKSLEQMVAKIW